MRSGLRALLVSLGFLGFVLAATAGAKEVPYLAGHVNDTANLIAPDARQRIEQKLTQYEQETGHQIVVLTVDSLDGDPIEDFSLRVAEAWKLGRKEQDDGALLLVSKGDRKMRIEVGYGLEANLTDLQTQIIQQEVIIPYFKNGDFGGGIEKGVDAIVDTLKGGEPQSAAPPPSRTSGKEGFSPGSLLFLLLFLFPFSAQAIRSRSWGLYLVFLPFYFVFGWLVSPIMGWILAGLWAVGFPILRALLPKGSGQRSSGSRSGGGWWLGGGGLGGGGGSWGGSGGGGGGGFSGGGGSFGGGGSSSSW